MAVYTEMRFTAHLDFSKFSDGLSDNDKIDK